MIFGGEYYSISKRLRLGGGNKLPLIIIYHYKLITNMTKV